MNAAFLQQNIWIIVLLAIWELYWKGRALWKSAQNRQKEWFVAILIFNTIGILPILYIHFFIKDKNNS